MEDREEKSKNEAMRNLVAEKKVNTEFSDVLQVLDQLLDKLDEEIDRQEKKTKIDGKQSRIKSILAEIDSTIMRRGKEIEASMIRGTDDANKIINEIVSQVTAKMREYKDKHTDERDVKAIEEAEKSFTEGGRTADAQRRLTELESEISDTPELKVKTLRQRLEATMKEYETTKKDYEDAEKDYEETKRKYDLKVKGCSSDEVAKKLKLVRSLRVKLADLEKRKRNLEKPVKAREERDEKRKKISVYGQDLELREEGRPIDLIEKSKRETIINQLTDNILTDPDKRENIKAYLPISVKKPGFWDNIGWILRHPIESIKHPIKNIIYRQGLAYERTYENVESAIRSEIKRTEEKVNTEEEKKKWALTKEEMKDFKIKDQERIEKAKQKARKKIIRMKNTKVETVVKDAQTEVEKGRKTFDRNLKDENYEERE